MRDAFERRCYGFDGAFVEIALLADEMPRSRADQDAIFDVAITCVGDIQDSLSWRDPHSDIGRLNHAAPGTVVRVASTTWEVLRIALDVMQASGGLFDCALGTGRDDAVLARPGMGPVPLRLIDDHQVEVHDRLSLNLGGIANGHAVDMAVDAIRRMGVVCCSVNAGGDVRAAGTSGQEVHVDHPSKQAARLFLGTISDGAVATSSPFFSSLPGADDTCALYDPAGHWLPANRSYTVIAPTCAVADALTKAVAVAMYRTGAQAASNQAPSTQPQPFQAAFLENFGALALVL